MNNQYEEPREWYDANWTCCIRVDIGREHRTKRTDNPRNNRHIDDKIGIK